MKTARYDPVYRGLLYLIALRGSSAAADITPDEWAGAALKAESDLLITALLLKK